MIRFNAVRDCASTIIGIGTGGILGTAAKKLTRAGASFETQLVTATAAVALGGAAMFLMPGFGAMLFLAGWMKTAVAGTLLSYAVASPGLRAQNDVQSARREVAEDRYSN